MQFLNEPWFWSGFFSVVGTLSTLFIVLIYAEGRNR